MERAPAECMDVKVKNRLAGALACIDDRPIAPRLHAALPRQLRGDREEVANEMLLIRAHSRKRLQMCSGHNKKMLRRRWPDVFKRDGAFVFINLLGGQAAANDLAEYAFRHDVDSPPA